MITKKDIKEVFALISIEFKDFLPKSQKDTQALANYWYDHLKDFNKEEVMLGLKEVLGDRVYGNPKVGDVKAAINEKKLSVGEQFANRIVQLCRETDAYKMEPYVLEEFGQLGVDIYLANYKRISLMDSFDRNHVMRDLADIYSNKYWLKYEANSFIEQHKQGMIENDK